jgi:hypothetical protein
MLVLFVFRLDREVESGHFKNPVRSIDVNPVESMGIGGQLGITESSDFEMNLTEARPKQAQKRTR